MISKKMEALVENSSVIRAMFEEGKKMADLYGAENVFDYSLGNPSIEPPDEVKKAIIDIVTEENPMDIHGYMNNSGYEEVRREIAVSLNKRFDTAFGVEHILMTVGAAGGLNVILKTLLNPGDEVIVFAPFFGEYRNYVNNYDGNLIVVPPDTKSFLPNLREFANRISERTKAVIVNTPNNPTGVVYSENTIKALAEIMYKAQDKFGTSIYLISDEPYRELAYDGVEVPFLTKYYENTIVGYSYSKSLSLPGERIGYLVMPGELDDWEEIVHAANVANRILGFVNAPSLLQKVIGKCVDVPINISQYDRNRKFLYDALSRCGYEMVKPEGAFYLFIKAFEKDDVAFSEKAKKHRLLLVPGSAFGCPGYVRLAYCVDYDMIKRSIPSFQALAKEYYR
ncbi:pyridoxal phosphate-dependent aminotransferase [Velocimicrobium porci]|uniref:Aminotransferase n=1 Tax=Velocimicrobium porci TaxID=2606634 RepID=A0A6L5XVZ2_9FIRM|nr:pyridoxal phosphate-dependent aminotransferase [Velocimicrobium porci]MSS62687.1 pyridoxal phosphate-dependent aminotransferase [Velocimicrobium porci]